MAAKIKDGLFIGDAETSQSEVFINDNKISNLINLSGREVQNIWSSHGLVYLTYYWEDRLDYKLFVNHEDTMLMDLVEFIDVSINHGISVLLFSRRGTGRCVVAACLYLMMKYRWGFEKTYDYVYSKKPDIDLNKGFIQQMFALDMKLLAARQKAFALLQGVDTGFKIEANMTISDIASMLPTREAKRWNAWDTDYLLDFSGGEGEDDGDSKQVSGDKKLDKRRGAESMNFHSGKLPSGSQNREDVEEELVLIYSFVNSKNTINSLPGPYRTAYEVPKHFKLRFDSVRLCQEEDIHMFPTSPPSNLRYAFPPKGILKGGRNHGGKMSISTGLERERDKTAQPKHIGKHHSEGGHRGAKEARHYAESTVAPTSHTASSNSLLDSIAPMHVINSARQQNGGALHEFSSSNGDTKATSSSGVSKPRMNDLYGFVGMAVSEGGKEGVPFSRSEAKHDSNHQLFETVGGRVNSAASSGTAVPLSAEDRLRNLMADMQRQNYGVSTNTAHNGTASLDVGGGKHRGGDPLVRESTIASMDFSASNPLRQQQQTTPSLYDLANMHFGGSGSQPRSTKNDPSSRTVSAVYSDGTARSSNREYGQYLSAPLSVDNEESVDPLSAFDTMQHNGSAPGRGGGAVRARHDIVSNQQSSSSTSYLNSGRGSVAYPPPPRVQQAAVRTAWSDSPSSSQQAQSRGVGPVARGATSGISSGSTRHASPSLRQHQGGSSLSVTSIHSGSASLNPQNNNQQQQQTAVGSGTSTGSRVYRHGSPAPNAVRSSRSVTPAAASSGGSVGSMGTIGSGGVGGGHVSNTGGAHRSNQGLSAPAPVRYSSSSGSRPASPMSARGASSTSAGTSRDQQTGTPQRRLSSNSVHTAHSENASAVQSLLGGGTASGGSFSQPDRRRSGSPMLVRTSQTGPTATMSGGGGVAGKRFSTPTPQSSQHHDYEAVGGVRGTVRSSTPTKTSWKF